MAEAKFRTGKFPLGIAFTICTDQFHFPENRPRRNKLVSKMIKDGFEEMEHVWNSFFGSFQDYLFKCSVAPFRKFFRWNDRKSRVPCTFQPHFSDFFFVNGRQPGTTKRTKFSQYWSSALAWTSVILAGKRNGRRHSTMGLSKNVAVSEISYQMLEVLSFCNLPSSKNNCANYSGEKSTMRLSGVYFLRIRVKKKSNLVLLVVLVIESKL